MTTSRLGNNELEFYESIIAGVLEINQAGKRALYWTDDPEVASQLALIFAAAGHIRERTIKRMDSRREEVLAERMNGKVK